MNLEYKTMLATTFLHKILQKSLSNMHQKRFNVLLEATTALLGDAKLTLTDIGRHIKGKAKVKNKIKKVDRLLKNKNLYKERNYIYQQLSNLLLKSTNKVAIAVDWSGCCSNERFIIQASMVIGQGRSIPVYKEIHSVEEYLKPDVESKFLDNLKAILPEGISITIVTDAGFRTPWFNKITMLGWDFVGRIRGKIYYRKEQEEWQLIKNLYNTATNKAKYIGKVNIGKTVGDGRVNCHMISYKIPKKYRRTKKIGRSHTTKKCAAANREPWILITSITTENKYKLSSIAKNIYTRRMEIEQNFRDDKSERFGYGLRYSRTKNIQRLEIMLLISHIATIILWLIGFAGELSGLQKDFQANTIKISRVLSLLTLGKQIVLHCLNKIKNQYIRSTLEMFSWCSYDMAISK